MEEGKIRHADEGTQILSKILHGDEGEDIEQDMTY